MVVGPRRNWLNLWKPTIDALDPLLGRTRAERNWHPKDGRTTDLGLNVAVDPSLGHDVVVTIAAAGSPATLRRLRNNKLSHLLELGGFCLTDN